MLSDAKPIVETVSCLKVNAALAEQPGERWAKQRRDGDPRGFGGLR